MSKRSVILGTILVLLAACFISRAAHAEDKISVKKPTKAGQLYAPNEIIVKFKQDLSDVRIEQAASRHGAEVFWKARFGNFKRLRIRAGSAVADMVASFSADPDVEYAEPNYIAYAHMVPNDPYYRYQWNFGSIRMENAWDKETGNPNMVVAVIDTGVAYENYTEGSFFLKRAYYLAPDLAQTRFVAGYDFVNNDTHPNDDEGHGTHVAGTIAQSTNNGIGVAGVAFNVSIMPLKALNQNGSGTYADIAEGIRFAADNGAKVINMSLGGSSPSLTLGQALAYAYNKGVTIVCSSGNNGSATTISYPAAYDAYCIAVGATRYDEKVSYYSNRGPSLDIVAPGGDVTVDQNGDGYGDGILQQTFGNNTNDWGYWLYQGTSMAAPHVSAAAALLIAHGVAATPDEVRKVLESTAKDLGPPGFDTETGHGLLDVYAALQWKPKVTDNPPTVLISSPADGAVVSGIFQIQADASDDVGIDRVSFSVDGSLIGLDSSAPYSVSWNSAGAADGLRIIEAIAYDTIGQTANNSIIVNVDNVNDAPVANAGLDKTVSDSDGTGSELVTLDGSASYDPDGTIASYEWKEAATLLGTAKVLSSAISVGSHTITLTVTDNKGKPASDAVIVNVLANQSPIASAGADKLTSVGEMVSFDGSGSSDPDGSIISYAWGFGDGATGSGARATHAYARAGTYTATLTVTDNGGLAGTDTSLITVSEAPSNLEVFADSFELGQWNGLWTQDSQNDWFISTQRSVNGTHSAEVDGFSSNAALISTPINLHGRTNATISFSWYIESSLDTGEYLAFDVSTNGGTTWVEKASLKGNVDQENVWHNVDVELSGISGLRLRFRGKMSSSIEDADLDMVKVIAH